MWCIVYIICFRPIEQKSIQLMRYTQVNKQTNKQSKRNNIYDEDKNKYKIVAEE